MTHAGHDHGEIGNRQAIFRAAKSTRTVLSSTTTNCSGLVERARAHLEGREAADADGAIQRPFHVLRRHRRAVVEGRVLLRLEGDGHVADVHVLGEFRLELVAVVIGHAARTAFHLVADQAVVAIPRHLVAGHVGADAMNVEIVGARFRRRPAASRSGRPPWRPDQIAGAGHRGPRRAARRRFEKIATLRGCLQTRFGDDIARIIAKAYNPLTNGITN